MQNNNDVSVSKRYRRRGQWQMVVRRLMRNKAAMAGLLVVLVFVVLALCADLLYDYNKDVIKPDYGIAMQGPSGDHWLGTDEFGRDILARLVFGARISLRVGIIAVLIGCFTGTTIGAVAGFYGGKIDNILMRLMDIFMAVPSILMSITIVAALGTSMFNLMIAIGLSSVPGYARIVRAEVLRVKDQEFIEAARIVGQSNGSIIFREVIPNCMAPIIVKVTMGIAGGILSTSSLSFLGLGVQPPTPEWGAMLSSGRQYLRQAPHLCTFPGLAILIIVLALNFLGDGLRDALDPRLKK